MQIQDNIENIYTIIRPLDEGTFSITYLVKNENDHNQYAAKVMDDFVDQQHFSREVQITTIISGLNNPNLIHLFHHGNGKITIGGDVIQRNYLILDYHSKGSLFEYVEIPGHGFTELYAKNIFYKILRGVKAFHGAAICHRQLTLENILLDQNYNPIICNFELATNNNVNSLNDFFGVQGYRAPQIINHQIYNGFKADIFTLGALLFNLVTGLRGFHDANVNDINYGLIYHHHFNEYWDNMQNIGINPSQ